MLCFAVGHVSCVVYCHAGFFWFRVMLCCGACWQRCVVLWCLLLLTCYIFCVVFLGLFAVLCSVMVYVAGAVLCCGVYCFGTCCQCCVVLWCIMLV